MAAPTIMAKVMMVEVEGLSRLYTLHWGAWEEEEEELGVLSKGGRGEEVWEWERWGAAGALEWEKSPPPPPPLPPPPPPRVGVGEEEAEEYLKS